MISKSVDSIYGKYKCRINGELIYCLALVIALGTSTLMTTMFVMPGILYNMGACIAIMLLIAKIVIFDKNTLRSLIFKGSIIALSIIAYMNNRNIWIACWMVLLVGAIGVRFEKILNIYLVITISVVTTAFIASLLNVIVNLRYYTVDGYRNSFGIVYPTDFAAHVFFIMATLIYLRRDSIRKIHLLLFLLIDGIVFYYCLTKLDCQCILLLIVGVLICQEYERLAKRSARAKYRTDKQRDYSWIGIGSTIFTIICMSVLSWTYGMIDYSPEFVKKYWTLFERFRLSKAAFTTKHINLFGQYIVWLGNGGTLKKQEGYNFVDCSYFKCLYDNGVILSILVMIVIVYCCKKMKRDILFQVIMAVLAVNYMIAHHMLDISYNIFLLVAFASIKEKATLERVE